MNSTLKPFIDKDDIDNNTIKNEFKGLNFPNYKNNLRYDYVFIAEPWEKIFKNDEERYESFEELKIINKHIKTTYSGNGYDYFILPEDSIEQRVNFIIKTIK